jgi:hypothetical protein
VTKVTEVTMVRWAGWCLLAGAVFQVIVAVLLAVNFGGTVDTFIGHGFAPTRDAARTSALGGLVVHLVLAVLCLLLARAVPRGGRTGRVLATVLLALIAIGGVAAMALPSQTWLSPIGVALALVGLVLLWLPTRARGRSGAPTQ